MSRLRTSFLRNWFAVEAIPIYCVVGFAVAGGGWYMTRLATRPDIVWTKNNPTPWNNVKQDENIKLATGNHKFQKSWSRDKL